MNILGIIPARKNSKEIKKKNHLKIDGWSLAEKAVLSAKKSKLINKIIFSSDDKILVNKVKQIGPYCPFVRPKYLSEDNSSNYEVCRHAVKWLEKKNNWNTDIVVLLQPTTPFRTPNIIDEVIKKLLNSKADSIITITSPSYPHQWALKMKGKYLNLIEQKSSMYRRRQDVPQTFIPAGMVYALRKDTLFKLKGILPQKKTMGFFVKPNIALNIDNYSQYLLAKIFSKNKKKFLK